MIHVKDLVDRTTAPENLGDTTTVGDHLLDAVAGALPCNELVWECQCCGIRGVDTDVYKREECDDGT